MTTASGMPPKRSPCPPPTGSTWPACGPSPRSTSSRSSPATCKAVLKRSAALLATLAEMAMLDADLSPAPELVEALLRTGSTDEAATVAARYGDLAAAKGLPWAQARAARLRGLLCAPHEMDGCFAEALALHAQTPDMYEEARTRLLYGERLRRARRRADARNPLRLALDRFQQLGAWPWVDLAAAELEVTGETVVRRDRDQRDALTPRELQVAVLLAEGRTTREAAAALFLSPKTVEYHLRHVYTKLAITSRSQLAAAIASPPEQP